MNFLTKMTNLLFELKYRD
ncbi:hypothetical protein F383_15231 [Gossypium arboreum]|uniref:Uncharacterized protein n=1 Tax=Gossypium arboreum TaxID=29729 RepID=A0A0B0N481_GOSAR|nr:hypothetical protein F383_15231 [Gossypium arboreum]